MTKKELFLILTNSSEISSADSVILLEGDGYSRIPKAVSLIKEGFAKTLVFSGGFDNESSGSFTFEKCKHRFLEIGYDINNIILETKSQNTRQQALETIELCLKKGWKKIILVASHYHQYRAFLTFLKVLEEKDLLESIQIMNSPAILNWFEDSDSGKIRLDLLKEEFIKIRNYRLNHHVSSYSSAVKYYMFWKDYR